MRNLLEDNMEAFVKAQEGHVPKAEEFAIRLWDVEAGREVRHFQDKNDTVVGLAFSPDGQTLASTRGVDICLWDTPTGKLLRKLDFQARPDVSRMIMCLQFSPDGTKIAAGFGEHWNYKQNHVVTGPAIAVLDVSTGRLSTSLETCNNPVNGLQYSADGRLLALACRDGSVRVFEIATGRIANEFHGHSRKSLWEVGGQPGTACVAFAPNSRQVVSGGSDTTGLVWDLTRGRAGDGAVPLAIGPQQFESLWTDLAANDAACGQRAVWSLVAAPGAAVSYLSDHLLTNPALDPRFIGKLVTDLDSAQFPVRDRATATLEKIGEFAGPALRRAVTETTSAEMRRRAAQLLEKLSRGTLSRECLRFQRSLQALEQIGTPESVRLLQVLRSKIPAGGLRDELEATLHRLHQRSGCKDH